MHLQFENRIKTAYKFVIFMLFLNSMHPWYIWTNQLFLITIGIGALCSIAILCLRNPFRLSKEDVGLFFILLIYSLFECLKSNINGIIQNIALFVVWWGLLSLNNEDRKEYINYITKWFSILLLISLFTYLLWLFDIWNIEPTEIEYKDVGYSASNYITFIIQNDGRLTNFFRFMSIFAEPGHMTMGIVPLIILNNFNLKNKYVLILFIAEIWSFSLAGMITLFIGYVLFNFNKHLIKGLAYLILACSGLVIMFESLGYGDVIEVFLWSRLEVNDDGNIAGNNRFTSQVDTEYNKLFNSIDFLCGKEVDQNIIDGSAGYKVFIIQNGLVGLILAISIYSYYFLKYKTYRLFIVTVIYLLLLTHNSYHTWMCMLALYLLDTPLPIRQLNKV